MASTQTNTYSYPTSNCLDAQLNELFRHPEGMSLSLGEGSPRKEPPIIYTNTPTWRPHIYVVHIVDFKVDPQYRRGDSDSTAHGPNSNIESGIFIQTHRKLMRGFLYVPRRRPDSFDYELQRQECTNLMQHDNFDSESPIGFIFKKDYEEYFNNLLVLTPLPQKPNHNTLVHGQHQFGNGQDLPPMDSTD
ncbi:hypothetical protein FSARC_13625 [Fusarium sarcochroum]|uniref:Uncharacterized protein n=1 Tax=Fusarium sarcochroum TaxID=1208366 RepID=A0A8H4WS80_9HYPO|nr:hypothetical protein FSARC_13625 [Fusarium sarcochroum]